MLDILNVNLKYIFLTHCHGDHIGAMNELKQKMGGKILISRDDYKGLTDESLSLTYYIEMENPDVEADSRVDDNDLIHIGDIEFKVISTPGHTKGGLCLFSEKYIMLFSGDTIFSGTWGRTDLPTGSLEDIMDSIINKILVLPEDTIVYPGHRKVNNDKRRKTNLFGIKKKRLLKKKRVKVI